MRMTLNAVLLPVVLGVILSALNVQAKSHRVRALDNALVSMDVTNQVVTIDISDGTPNQKFVIECTTDFRSWNTLVTSRLSLAGAFNYQFECLEPKCFFRVRHGK